MSNILEKSVEKCFAEFTHNILKKLLKKATVQKENSLFRMVIYHKTAERRIMTFTKWVPKNSVDQHEVLI